MSAPSFRKGGTAAKEEAKKQNASFAKINWLDVADGESIIVRFLDDSSDWLFVNQHNFVPTKGAPKGASDEERKKFPASMGAVCRYDEAFHGIYNDCYICDHMRNDKGKKYSASLRLWARAVERELVKGTQEMVDAGQINPEDVGKRLGYRDKLVDRPILDAKGEPTGKTGKVRKIIVVRMGFKNFFGQLQGYADVYGTVLSRDMHITREGTGLDTKYNIVALDEIPGFSLQDPALKAKYDQYAIDAGVSLEEVISGQASDEYYARFFDPTKEVAPRGESKKDTRDEDEGAPAEQQQKPKVEEPSEDALEAMRARVRSGNPAPAAPALANLD